MWGKNKSVQRQKLRLALTFCALSACIARMYFQTPNRTVFSSSLNTPAIILSVEYVFSQYIAMRKWEIRGLAIRAASICVICRSEKIALCVSGLAPKWARNRSRFVLSTWFCWVGPNPTDWSPSESHSSAVTSKMTMSETWQPSQMGNHAMQHFVKIESIEWIETGGNSCVRDIRCNHADISNSTHENENSWQSALVQASFQTFDCVQSKRPVATLVMHPEPRIQDNTTHKDRLLRHKSHQVMTNRLSSSSPIVVQFLPFFVPFRQSSSVCERAVSVSAPFFVHFSWLALP